MKFTIVSYASLALLASSVSALQPGDIPSNIAVRSSGDGEIHHYYEKDAIEYFKKRSEAAEAELAKRDSEIIELRKRQDAESDLYPVSSSGGTSGLSTFAGAGDAGGASQNAQ
ncbi:hypothetical protein B9479_007880 [Cryptococcus floricola]|uniref:Uncharacterized protein n=1 Tax=Cryptococcus floricola TaxID=2591691 RepID=A0A5D3AL79_9TREE|nr:hypothetical protein B9479_007880 [Cryptococcus floricola]